MLENTKQTHNIQVAVYICIIFQALSSLNWPIVCQVGRKLYSLTSSTQCEIRGTPPDTTTTTTTTTTTLLNTGIAPNIKLTINSFPWEDFFLTLPSHFSDLLSIISWHFQVFPPFYSLVKRHLLMWCMSHLRAPLYIHTYIHTYKVGKTQLETWNKSRKLTIMSVMQMHNKLAA